MIIYSGTIKQFNVDVLMNVIADKLEELFREHDLSHNNLAEHRAWQNSLLMMKIVLDDKNIDDEIRIAIEYQIPLTAKRVDFLVTGKDAYDNDSAVVIELKQWEQASRTSRDDIVSTYTGGAVRDVVHPCYQAYSYAKTIANYNMNISSGKVKLIPCAYLHNYKDEYIKELVNPQYQEAINLAPIFFSHDAIKLREFISKYVKKHDNGQILYKIENGKIKPSKALQDAVTSLMDGNEEFVMIDEQKVAFETIKKLLINALSSNKKYTVIVQGGPGTGKSVIAINLLAELIRHQYSVNYVTKNSAPRFTFSQNLIHGHYQKRYVENLFRGSGSFVDAKKDTFDCILCDEAHRLNAKSGMFANLGENQIKEIINASRVSVFFIDEDQVVTTKDIGSVAEIKRWADICGSEVYMKDDIKLVSQFRCNGSDGYLAFLDHVLGIRETANQVFEEDMDYDVRIFDDPNDMREELRKHNANNKARMIAGYCYDWISKQNKSLFDVQLKNGFHAQWNFTTNEFATDPSSFEQVGCIHSTQGLEFDYVGVIIGLDMRYENGNVITDFTKRSKQDASLKGIKTSHNYELADRIIRNTYKTLLSRGQKGCFVYCEDQSLSDYLSNSLKQPTLKSTH